MKRYDVGVVGSGFGGSLCAAILARQGLQVILLDKCPHPRFAIGESSTPIADMILRDLAVRYDLPELTPLTRYGDWCRTYPQLMRGCKRGFSYFHHTPQREFSSSKLHSHELLVAASSNRDLADTHWLRADVDQFLFEVAQRHGAEAAIGRPAHCTAQGDRWLVHGSGTAEHGVLCDFVIDATGGAGQIFQGKLPIQDVTAQTLAEYGSGELFAGSRGLFAHFMDVVPWADVLDELGLSQVDYPFPCDDAALHHLLDEGWMWQLRFDNGVVSAGFALDTQTCRMSTMSPAEEWQRLLQRYPSIARQFAQARSVAPPSGLIRTGPLQRFVTGGGGANWALLPYAIGFVDPLHSTGIAHTLSGVERLIPLVTSPPSCSRSTQLRDYGNDVLRELQLILGMVGLCYRTRREPLMFEAATMFYFAAVTTFERGRAFSSEPQSFLGADHSHWFAALKQLQTVLSAISTPSDDNAASLFWKEVSTLISPFNKVGLCNPAANRCYRHTAISK